MNPTYEYDSVDNLQYEKTGATIQREITWTGFNMPSKITKGVSTIEFLYDADHARVYEARKTGATFDSQTYFVNAGNALFFEIETKGTITEWKHYLHAPSGLLMMRSIKSNTTAKTDVYFHKDHLGSITTITNNIGAILEQNSFDAFGKRRNSNGSDATATINSLTRRGFTQHEMLPEVNMVHMNGRVYEPTLGRFMSADPNVQFAGFSQSYNRYSYGFNNPLSGTDPSGFDFWSRAKDSVREWVRAPNIENTYNLVRQCSDGGAHDRFFMNNSWARAIGHAAAGAIPGYGWLANAAISGYVVWLQGGSRDDIGKAWGISIGTYWAMQGVDTGSGWVSDSYGSTVGNVTYIAGYAVVGCASTSANGGSCGRGAAISGITAGARIYYRSFTGRDATWKQGDNRYDSIRVPCDDSGSNCFEFDKNTGYIPDSFGNANAIGLDKELTGNFWDDFGKQSGPLSRALNLVPGMNALAVFHDTIFGPKGISFTLYSNVGTMLPAAVITYSALIAGPASLELAKKRNINFQN